ncbi:uncharacterized protein BKA55DRAFT_583325 [Fusarium redolens]|uniref:Uncharacterized protein n=1 Tax=Fusarium redolens TaxID=48865 RepID=A0A9P9JR30_FUSRE|nr:uncharacterized protein BKA55DRAFT_583325 [Fusarium redolens]KAH7230051.1 hypothetical protein BKA55DRAFT_583325 [Fusarium redolens]
MQTVNQYNLAVVLFTAFGSFTYGVNSSIITSRLACLPFGAISTWQHRGREPTGVPR